MPIRINLLAESQAVEELRRRDPVKRAIWGGGILVGLLLAYSVFLLAATVKAKAQLSKLDAEKASHKQEADRVKADQKKLADVNFKLAKLLELSTNRFLNGTLLNTLQQTTVEDVQLIHFKAEQKYTLTPETPTQTNDEKVIKGKPATVKEQITLIFGAKDSSPTAGEQVDKYKAALSNCTLFQRALSKTNQISLVDYGPKVPGQPLPFTLQFRYPDKTR